MRARVGSRRRFLAWSLAPLVVGIFSSASPRAEEDLPLSPPARPILSDFAPLGSLELPVSEISGLAVLPGTTAQRASLLVLTDEGPYEPEHDRVRGALYRVELEFPPGSVRAAPPRAVTLHVHVERFDPGWPSTVSPFDLEALAPLPGRPDLFLLSGERNPEDQTDDGANRLYVVRYPDAGDANAARVVGYVRLLDLEDDGMNDRFEGVVALAGSHDDSGATTWPIVCFKERTSRPGAVPGYVRGHLTEGSTGFAARMEGDRGYPPLPARHLATSPEVVSSQSDAAAASDGTVWVLDRWRRVLHVVGVPSQGDLVLQHDWDLWEVLRDIEDESAPTEPAPAGMPDRVGYGRHEGVAFDPQGRVYLASDRGGRRPSTLTILVPR